jgi:cation diffusion facilitator family transporter
MADDGHGARARTARQVSGRSRARENDTGESRKTVLMALAANAVIAVIKLAGGLLSGSTALLAEAAHSLADTVNQGFLLTSLSISRRAPDERQPFGYGQQRYLWTFVAAMCMFLAGAIFAVGYGVFQIVAGGESSGSYAIAWVTLTLAALAEGVSWARAMRQTRAGARQARRGVRRYARESRDPSVKMVLVEDSAGLAGVLIAALGIGLDQITGSSVFDPAASVLIGIMLMGVALWLARDSGMLLAGAAARPEERETIERVLEEHPGIVEVNELLTMVLGPNALLVAARVDVADQLDGRGLERVAGEVDRAIREAVPDVTEVFVDPTDRAERDGPAAA